MKVLLTGATGFIGRHLLPRIAQDHDVVAVARRDPPPDLAPLAEWLTLDLASDLDAARLPARVDAIVHLAQSSRYRDFPDGAADVFALNVRTPAALADYGRAAGAQRFVLCSTGGVYGYNDELVREGHAVSPINYYLASKYAAEVLLAPYRAALRTIVLRPFFVYGAGQRGMLVAGLADRVLRGEEIVVDGDPGLRINPIHVEDAARAITAAMALDRSDVVNVAGDDVVTITDLAQRLGAAAGVEPRVTHRDPDPDGDLLGDNSRMKALLGVVPEVSLEAGLRGVIDELRSAAG